MFIYLCVICAVSHAQLYYYIEAGEELTQSTDVLMVYIEGSKLTLLSEKASSISGHLSQDSYYWVRKMRNRLADTTYGYDNMLSNSSYKVYKSPDYSYINGYFPQPDGHWASSKKDKLIGYHYTAISSDKSVRIFWYQTLNSNEVKNKTYYNRINESQLNIDPYDFLH